MIQIKTFKELLDDINNEFDNVSPNWLAIKASEILRKDVTYIGNDTFKVQ